MERSCAQFCSVFSSFFFFNDTATTEIYTLSLHDALPISTLLGEAWDDGGRPGPPVRLEQALEGGERSEEHTSELQSQSNLVCRLLLEKKKRRRKMSSENRSGVKRPVSAQTRLGPCTARTR